MLARQTWLLELDSWNSCKVGNKEPTSLISTCMLWQASTRMCTYRYKKIKKGKFKDVIKILRHEDYTGLLKGNNSRIRRRQGEMRRGYSTDTEDTGRSHKPEIKMPLEA